MSRIWNVLVAMTQGLNAVTGGNPDQSFSGRTALEARAGSRWAVIREAFINLIFAILAGQRDHCEASIEWDEVT